jgi:hypothetical protein
LQEVWVVTYAATKRHYFWIMCDTHLSFQSSTSLCFFQNQLPIRVNGLPVLSKASAK